MGKKKGPSLSPLFEAADTNDVDALLEIIGKDKAQLEVRNSDGWTALHQAAYAGAVDCVEELLKAGAAVGAICKQGDTPLHYASAQSNGEVIAMLAKAGAPLELKDKDGETPMDVAGNRATKKLIEQLIAKREAEGLDTGKGRADGQEDSDEDWEEVDEEELGAEEMAALTIKDDSAAAGGKEAAGQASSSSKGKGKGKK
uniref:Uncharacterized protein n=1 Tax=Chlamydomonas leiostraca TaxID=1034604 RepID=A0A7S0X0U1_9CHLO